MEALVAVMICFLVVYLLVVGVSLIWRINMMVNHPEQYRQFREFEKEFADDVRDNMRKQGEVLGKAVEGGVSIAKGFLKK